MRNGEVAVGMKEGEKEDGTALLQSKDQIVKSQLDNS